MPHHVVNSCNSSNKVCIPSEALAKIEIEQIELQAKLLNYFLGSNKSNINQNTVNETYVI